MAVWVNAAFRVVAQSERICWSGWSGHEEKFSDANFEDLPARLRAPCISLFVLLSPVLLSSAFSEYPPSGFRIGFSLFSEYPLRDSEYPLTTKILRSTMRFPCRFWLIRMKPFFSRLEIISETREADRPKNSANALFDL